MYVNFKFVLVISTQSGRHMYQCCHRMDIWGECATSSFYCKIYPKI